MADKNDSSIIKPNSTNNINNKNQEEVNNSVNEDNNVEKNLNEDEKFQEDKYYLIYKELYTTDKIDSSIIKLDTTKNINNKNQDESKIIVNEDHNKVEGKNMIEENKYELMYKEIYMSDKCNDLAIKSNIAKIENDQIHKETLNLLKERNKDITEKNKNEENKYEKMYKDIYMSDKIDNLIIKPDIRNIKNHDHKEVQIELSEDVNKEIEKESNKEIEFELVYTQIDISEKINDTIFNLDPYNITKYHNLNELQKTQDKDNGKAEEKNKKQEKVNVNVRSSKRKRRGRRNKKIVG
ncbi:hypothetical protein EDEG_03256 [Edhazardia aedis USNM 41457]|uniref:Uncharacterized protein n=1 Tax=Edhazardia aedis (strain USNM 41457) TaxID=1003232 RepID=J9D392_EDHAE|nr:hypothetical protein EDEG_03256 [Edhazardia aedis USNM 41457]|eukprot:EJW02306.1 hypothetical protein EDEG_03256 [Edhazardia aedis USNM 41457]